ncbi:MAG: SDR family oxidoreductase [Phycisphaerales bacterium]|nr:SDR family oxidoreductase [Phycisphaerales bacterium]
MPRLNGKVAFLTGGAAGIAKASAVEFVKEGAKVALVDINAEALQRAEQDIRALGGDVLVLQADVTQEESVKSAVESAAARFGRIDVLVNAAGGSLLEDAPVHEMDIEIWRRTIMLNLLNPFLCCKHVIPHMMKNRSGSIINFSSMVGMVGMYRPAYAAAKGGIMSFTKTLAAQYAEHGIRANAIGPGSVRTERTVKRYQNKDWMLADAPSPAAKERRIVQSLYPFSTGDAIDIASICVFLASDESRMLTGTTIAADGGRSAYLKVYAGD